MNHIDITKKMIADGYSVIGNPKNQESSFAGMSTEEIKATRRDKTQQFQPAVQHELSLRGDRLAFVEFHRFMYGIENTDILLLKGAMKQHVIEEKLAESEYVYCDQQLLNDAIDFQLCIRFEKWFDVNTADQISRHFKQKCKLAESYPEITSDHLIAFATDIFNKYAKKGKNIKIARETLGLSQVALAEKLGWTGAKQISNLETGARQVQRQTELAVECLLRREGKFKAFLSAIAD